MIRQACSPAVEMDDDDFMQRTVFAGWCAATAARSSPIYRFKVSQGLAIISKTELPCWARGWDKLPASGGFDANHREMRKKVIDASACVLGKGSRFSHGVAAKLINCYLKALYGTIPVSCLDEFQRAKRNALHPPIDRLLMQSLLKQDDEAIDRHRATWKKLTVRDGGWSLMDSGRYEETIEAIRQATGGELWRIERYWPGHA